jgi:hypothetical protein
MKNIIVAPSLLIGRAFQKATDLKDWEVIINQNHLRGLRVGVAIVLQCVSKELAEAVKHCSPSTILLDNSFYETKS